MARKKIDTRKLKNDAATALRKGKFKAALKNYLELEKLEPKEVLWTQKIADTYHRMKDSKNEMEALLRATERYMEGGFSLKAIAACKQILTIDPEHEETQGRLAELTETPQKKVTTTSSLLQGMKRKSRTKPTKESSTESTEEESSLEEVNLADSISGATPLITPHGPSEDINVIPLDDEVPELELNQEAGVPATPPNPNITEELSAELKEFDISEFDEVQTREIEKAQEGEISSEIAREFLTRAPLFSSLTQEAIQNIIIKSIITDLPEDEILFQQGDRGDALYVIVEGAVAAVADGRRFTVLEEGSFFGEIALIADQPRNATIQALVDTKLLVIHRSVINSLIRKEPEALRVILRFVRDRLIHRMIRTHPLFRSLPMEKRLSLASHFSFVEVKNETFLIRQGETSSALYFMLSGTADVISEQNGESMVLAQLKACDLFGEVSLLRQTPAGASVRTASKCFVLALPADQFDDVIRNDPDVREYVDDLAQERQSRNSEALGHSNSYDQSRVSTI